MSDIQTLTTLGAHLEQLNTDIEIAEHDLDTLKQKKRQLQEETLPEIMFQLGLEELKLAGGGRIVLTKFVDAKMKQEATCLAWLKEHKHEAIVKSEFKINLRMGEDDTVLREKLSESNIPFTEKVAIHPATLKKFARERIDEGDTSFPKEAFGVYEGNRVIFK